MKLHILALTALLLTQNAIAADSKIEVELKNGRVITGEKVWRFANKTHLLRDTTVTSLDDTYVKKVTVVPLIAELPPELTPETDSQ